MVLRARSVLSWLKHHPKRAIALLIIIGIVGFIVRPKPLPPLETVKAEKGKIIETVSASGTVQAKTSVNLSFLSGGKVTYVGAKKGDTVSAYQTIATLDQRTIQKNLEDTLRDYSKQRNAFDKLQDENADRRPSEALTEAMRRVLENNQYDLDKAILSVELQQLAKEQAILYSPIAGTVTRADIETPGVNASVTTTYTIADLTNMVFKIEVDEADIGKVRENQKIEVVLDAYPNHTLTLAVTRIDVASHTTSTGGTVYDVETALPSNSDNRYRIGMNGDAEIIITEKRNVVIIPISSVIEDEYVYVKKDKIFEKRKVTLGIENGTEIEVKKGLQPGEEVAVLPDEAEKRFAKKQ